MVGFIIIIILSVLLIALLYYVLSSPTAHNKNEPPTSLNHNREETTIVNNHHEETNVVNNHKETTIINNIYITNNTVPINDNSPSIGTPDKTEPQPTTKTQKNNTLIPNGYALDANGLPYKTNCVYGWGREFNAFVTPAGSHYHRSSCRRIKGKHKKLIHRYEAMKKYSPCTQCKPKNYIDDWFKALLSSKN